VLKELPILPRELSFVLNDCDILQFSSPWVSRNFGKVLVNLEFVGRNYMNFGKSGVDKAFCLL